MAIVTNNGKSKEQKKAPVWINFHVVVNGKTYPLSAGIPLSEESPIDLKIIQGIKKDPETALERLSKVIQLRSVNIVDEEKDLDIDF